LQPALWTLFSIVSLLKLSLGYLMLCLVRLRRALRIASSSLRLRLSALLRRLGCLCPPPTS
jgi:hypothetical protein